MQVVVGLAICTSDVRTRGVGAGAHARGSPIESDASEDFEVGARLLVLKMGDGSTGTKAISKLVEHLVLFARAGSWEFTNVGVEEEADPRVFKKRVRRYSIATAEEKYLDLDHADTAEEAIAKARGGFNKELGAPQRSSHLGTFEM